MTHDFTPLVYSNLYRQFLIPSLSKYQEIKANHCRNKKDRIVLIGLYSIHSSSFMIQWFNGTSSTFNDHAYLPQQNSIVWFFKSLSIIIELTTFNDDPPLMNQFRSAFRTHWTICLMIHSNYLWQCYPLMCSVKFRKNWPSTGCYMKSGGGMLMTERRLPPCQHWCSFLASRNLAWPQLTWWSVIADHLRGR